MARISFHAGIVLRFDPFLFRVLRHCAWVRSLRFVSGSPTLRSDLNPFFCFGFSDIALEFDHFILFWVLRHRAQISLSSTASCPDSSSSLVSCQDFIIFSGIVSGFPYLHRHCIWITHLPKHHARVSLSPSVVATQFR